MVVDRVSLGVAVRRVAAIVATVGVLAVSSVWNLSPLPGATGVARASSNCQVVGVSPQTVPDGSDDGFAFNVLDTTDAIAWVSVTTPSQNVVLVNGGSDYLPTVSLGSYNATYSGSAINPGTTIEVDAEAIVSTFSPPAGWIVQASTDQNGLSPMTCSGNTALTVTDTTPPQITSISVQAQTTSATVSWNTDKNTTGQVDYGTTPSYAGHQQDSALTSGHQVVITGLRPATTYHYQITATDQFGNMATSVDGTFFTAAVPVSTTQPASGGSTPVTVKVTAPDDKTPPMISLTTTLPRIIKADPTISGKATDDNSVVRVEYSTDGGKDWLPADVATGLGSKKVAFSFTPVNLDDGTYTMVARAIDGGGNTATTTATQVIIDRKPPIVGGNVISLGPQVLLPDNKGVTTTLPGVDLTAYLSATGGTTSISIHAEKAATAGGTIATSFTLHQSTGNGLWTGTLSFTKPGNYQLVADAADGAGNTTSRAIGNITVASPGIVLSSDGPVARASVTIYYLDPDSNSWTVWDGSPYSQANPVETGSHGSFSLLLPAGTYYAHVNADGYQDTNSASFSLQHPTPLTATFHMTRTIRLGPAHVPSFSFAVQPITFRAANQSLPAAFGTSSVVGSSIKSFTLTDSSGTTQNSIGWLGRPTVISVLSDWAPAAAEEMAALERLSTNGDVNVKAIGLQENAARLSADNAIAGSALPWLADPDSVAVGILNVGSVPANYFVDRKGVIQSVTYGPMSYQQLLDTLTNLP